MLLTTQRLSKNSLDSVRKYLARADDETLRDLINSKRDKTKLHQME